MSIIKCKMCGGDMVLSSDNTIGTCEYCGSTMTLPKIDDEKRLALYNRANHFRQQCAFDKAAQIYENIVSETPDDAEAHWSLVLCRYGIEYVEDPETFERIPTCHRASYDSIFDDIDYQEAVKNSDGIATTLYQKEARRIDRIQKGILEISKNEEPFDVFICYKETAVNGDRTLDSVKAQGIYDALTEKGYKVFFSRITLESKLGQAYEPYIFAALNSAKVMLVVGTSPENMNAVWVKNEWSRYLKLTKKDKNKTIIPCYLNMDPYDLPDEFSSLQAQDMSKIGFVQDIIRGIDKLVGKKQQTDVSVVSNKPQSDNSSAISFGFMKYEMGKTDEASTVFNNILQKDITCPEAYLGLAVITSGADFETYCKRFSQYAPKEISQIEDSVINSKNARKILNVYFNLKDIKRISNVLEKFPEAIDDNLLISAVFEFQDDKILDLLVKHGANLNIMIEIDHNSDEDMAEGCVDKRSLLSHTIMKHYSFRTVEALLKCGANPNSVRIHTNKYGSTEYSVLSDAICNSKDVEIVKILLENGADPNRVEDIIADNGKKAKKSMLSYAICDAESPEMVKLLLEHKANPNSVRIHTNKYGSTEYSVLSDAICNAKDVEMIKILLEHGADPNSVRTYTNKYKPIEEYSALSDAVLKMKNPEIVKVLLEYGADPNRIQNITYDDGSKEKSNVLSDAVCSTETFGIVKFDFEMVKLLLEHGANPNSVRIHTNKYGSTEYSVLSDAICKAKNAEIVKVLLENGAEPNRIDNITDDDGHRESISMLSYAVCVDATFGTVKSDMVKILLDYGANPNSVRFYNNQYGSNEYSVLSDAICVANNVEIVKMLLEQGADPNRFEEVVDNDGVRARKSMLLCAIVDAKDIEIVKLLLQYGASMEDKVTYNFITRKLERFPFQKDCYNMSKTFLKELRSLGWSGSLF